MGMLQEIEIEKVILDPEFNTRQKGPGDLTDLIESIKLFGIQEPILGRSSSRGVEIYAGFRRFEAAKVAGLATVPVIVVPETSITKKQMLLFNVTENVQREELNPVDEAAAYARLQQDHQMSTDDIAASLGVKKARIERRFALLKMSDVVIEAVHDGRISLAAAMEIDRLPREKQGKYVEIAEQLSSLKLKTLVSKELEKLQKKIELGEPEPKEPKEKDPEAITERVRRITKASTILCNDLDYEPEKVDRVKSINYKELDVEDVGVLAEFLEDIASGVEPSVDMNEKASEALIEAVESLGSDPTLGLNIESPVFKSWLTNAVGSRARELAIESAQGSGKRPKVTYALAETALMDFFVKR